jgi:hypothetical protein
MEALETVLGNEFPELAVNVPSIPGTSDIKQEELAKALQYIRKNNLVQDSTNLLASTEPMRSSVSYPIIFPNQERDLNFRVDWIQGPMVYCGYIQSPNKVGENVVQARLYGMRLK